MLSQTHFGTIRKNVGSERVKARDVKTEMLGCWMLEVLSVNTDGLLLFCVSSVV